MPSWMRRPTGHVILTLAALVLYHLAHCRQSEPFFNNDEIRHTLTGVFFRDVYREPLQVAADSKGFALRYYAQYPALGLITWPPLFPAVEGVAMLLLGPQFWVGRLCVALFSGWLAVSTYRLARLKLSHPHALVVMTLTMLTPLVFIHSERVMLEVPCAAFLLAAVYRFEHTLAGPVGRGAVLACLWAACATLTRFDGLLVGLYFAARLLATQRWGLLWRRPVVVGVLLALVLTVPYYVLTFVVYRNGLSQSAHPASMNTALGDRLWFYVQKLPEQAGRSLAAVSLLSLIVLVACRRRGVGAPLALIGSVYLFFTVQSELEARHAIYWLPALMLCVGQMIQFLRERCGARWSGAVSLLLIGAGLWHCHWLAFRYVRGYEPAVQWMLAHRTTDRPLMMDGEFSASFVYHVRIHDPLRRVWCVRGDKLLYSMFSDPAVQYKQYAATTAEMLDLLHAADPEYVMVEDPPPKMAEVPAGAMLRQLLKQNAAEYELVYREPVGSNWDKFHEAGTHLTIYRKLRRNPNASPTVQLEVFGLGGTIEVQR